MRGVSLVEALAVLAIVGIITAILVPVVVRAKLRGAQASCTSNLRQAGTAVNLYVETWNGEYPQTLVRDGRMPVIAPILAGTKSDILRCPLDRPQGRAALHPIERIVPISYKSTWLLWGYDSGYATWKSLLELDANPILLRCYLHDDQMRGQMLNDPVERGDLQNARSLALRKDGSVTLTGHADHAPLLIDSSGHATQDFKRDY